jgi:hypothetical protein
MRMTALDHWRDYIKSHDHRALWDLLHPDAVFESVVHTPQRGRCPVAGLNDRSWH